MDFYIWLDLHSWQKFNSPSPLSLLNRLALKIVSLNIKNSLAYGLLWNILIFLFVALQNTCIDNKSIN